MGLLLSQSPDPCPTGKTGGPSEVARSCAPSDRSLSQQPDRAGSSRHQGAIPADARVQKRLVRCEVLSKLRRTAKLPPAPFKSQQTCSRQSPPTAHPLLFPRGDQHPEGCVIIPSRRTDCTCCANADRTPGTARKTGLAAWLSRQMPGFIAWRRDRKAIAELSTMTERELMDIGLTRGDLSRVFESAFSQDLRQCGTRI
jgi:uncharacterized protein YjiS (DUF1127 family)